MGPCGDPFPPTGGGDGSKFPPREWGQGSPRPGPIANPTLGHQNVLGCVKLWQYWVFKSFALTRMFEFLQPFPN